MRERDALGIVADFRNEARVLSTPTFRADELERAAAALRRLRGRPWPHRAVRLGYDFETIHDAAGRRR
jgi:hypothetical protein